MILQRFLIIRYHFILHARTEWISTPVAFLLFIVDCHWYVISRHAESRRISTNRLERHRHNGMWLFVVLYNDDPKTLSIVWRKWQHRSKLWPVAFGHLLSAQTHVVFLLHAQRMIAVDGVFFVAVRAHYTGKSRGVSNHDIETWIGIGPHKALMDQLRLRGGWRRIAISHQKSVLTSRMIKSNCVLLLLLSLDGNPVFVPENLIILFKWMTLDTWFIEVRLTVQC